MNPKQLAILLAACIKTFGKDNVLKLDDAQLRTPFAVRLHSYTGDVIIQLLEGQEAIDKYEQTEKQLAEEMNAIPERSREPDDDAE